MDIEFTDINPRENYENSLLNDFFEMTNEDIISEETKRQRLKVKEIDGCLPVFEDKNYD